MSWVDAAQRGDTAALQGIADVQRLSSETDATALHYAAERGHDRTVEFLLGRGADCDAQDKYGRTPLYQAVFNSHLAVVTRLLQDPRKKANPDTQCQCGTSAVSKAAENGHVAILDLLLRAGAKAETRNLDGETPEDLAKRNGHFAAHSKFKFHRARRVDRLLDAAKHGSVPEIQRLVHSGVQANVRSIAGSSALDVAAQKGQTDAVLFLLRDANVPATDADRRGVTPLHWAAQHGHGAVIDLLLSFSANPDAPDDKRKTPLHWAAEKGHEGAVDRLCNGSGHAKADLNARAVNEATPLMLAAQHGRRAVVQLLLRLGADPALEDRNGETAKARAERNGHDFP